MFINCGAMDVTGNRFPTKRALKEALAADPSQVFFDRTSLHEEGGVICGSSIPDGVILTVVLPDPFHNRRAYANVHKQADGHIKVA